MSNYRAFILPDPRATLWDAQSSYTEKTSIVDTPERVSGETSLALSASGSLSTAQSSKEIRVEAISSGLPSSAGYAWTNNGDALYRGADSPVVARAWENLVWCSPVTANTAARYPSAISLPDQTVLVAYEERSAISNRAAIYKYTPSTGTWAKVTNVYSDTTITAILRPTLLRLSNGTILMFHWVEDTENDVAQVRSHYSTDEGATWSVYTLWALPSGVDTSGTAGAGAAGYDLGRLHAAELNGQVCLLAELVQHNTSQYDLDVFSQYVSSDNGATFSQVGSIWDGNTTADYITTVSERGGSRAQLVTLDSKLYLIYLETQWNKANCQAPAVRTIGSCSDSFLNASVSYVSRGEWATLSDATAGRGAATDKVGVSITDGELAAWTDERGTIYLAGRRTEGTQVGVLVSSGDGGNNWDLQGVSDGVLATFEGGLLWNFNDTGTYLREINAAPAGGGGRVALLHSHVADPGDEDNSLSCLWLGGWSTVTQPSLRTRRAEIDSVSWNYCYLPMDLPPAVGWTAAGTGGATLDEGKLILALGGGGNGKSFLETPVSTYERGIVTRSSFSVTAGGSLSIARAAIEARSADGAKEVRASLRASTTGFRIYDVVSGAQVGGTIALDMTAGIDVIMAVGDGKLRSWYRARAMGEDAEYIAGPGGALTVETGSPAANCLIKFGRITNSAITTMNIFEVWYTVSTYTGIGGERLLDNPANPEYLRPRELPSTGTYITGGVSLSSVAGPAFKGDIHKVAVTSPLNLARALPTGPTSPRQGWESTDETEQTIALSISPSGLETTEASNPLSDVIGVALMGINFKTAILQGYSIGAGWTDLLTLEANSGDLSWTRDGSTVSPNSVTSTFYDHHSLAGSTFKFDGGKAREVTANTSGYWATGATYTATALTLSGVDGTEGTSGTTGRVWFPKVSGIVRLNGAKYSAYRIKIAASQGTISGTYKIGSICLGPVMLLSDQYSWGRSITTQRNIDIVQARDWSITSRGVSPSRKVIEVGWTHGVDEDLISSNSTVSLSTAGGALPVGTKGSTLLQLEGLLSQNTGEPIVYLPSVPSQAATGSTFTSSRDFTYCMIEGDFRRDTVLGEEGTELARAPKLTLKELI